MSKVSSRVPRVSRPVVIKMARLLYMEYKPSEIADELGISTKTIYDSYIPAGLPHRRDAAGNIWIVGTVFKEWAITILQTGSRLAKQRNKQPMKENEAYCVGCRGVREFSHITKREKYSGSRLWLYGLCSTCGSTMVSMRKVKDDKSQ
jgi:hypothetical protein